MNALKESLNQLREISSEIFHKYVPVIDDVTDISAYADPIFNYPEVYNEFCNVLVNKLVYTQFETKIFRNPLKELEGDRIPLGYAGEEGYVNPAKARGFNVNDFCGLLVKYEADVKIQYQAINSDVQYPVTISRQTLKKAFTSWNSLAEFITSLSNSLYNGAYIDEFRGTKNIISAAYKDNKGVIETITPITDAASAKAFIEKVRSLYLKFQLPSSNYNAWSKNDGTGRPVTTWTLPEDVVLILKADEMSKIDVEVLAVAFNMTRTELMGHIIVIDDFNVYDDDGDLVFDGSKIVALLADKSWFRIKTQDMYLENFYNPNNRTMQYYLNVIKMYNFSLFANGVIFATDEPENVPYTSLSYGDTTEVSVDEGDTEGLELIALPTRANASISYESSDTDVFTVVADEDDDRKCIITGVDEGSATLTATSGSGADAVTATITVNVVASA